MAIPARVGAVASAARSGIVDEGMDEVGHSSTARLERGAGVLLVIFWTVHLVIMLVRAEIYDEAGQVGFVESFVRRAGFALFGAFLGYLLYRCLRTLRGRPFNQQAALGAAFALSAACVQAVGNAIVFNAGSKGFLADFLYSLMYWFWFYFCWTTAYLALSYSIRVQEQERHAAELAVKAQEAHVRALRYQINPHFLFNTLNAIAALVRDAPDQAEEMVVQLSDFFRRSLAIEPTEDVSLREEVELQRLYLEIERTRFPNRMRFEVQLDEDSAEARVPALVLQPLVENAVKHGVAHSEEPTCVRVLSRLDGQMLEIVVENDARPTARKTSGETVGLRNVVERLQARYGDEASFEAAELPGGGFRNRMRLPTEA